HGRLPPTSGLPQRMIRTGVMPQAVVENEVRGVALRRVPTRNVGTGALIEDRHEPVEHVVIDMGRAAIGAVFAKVIRHVGVGTEWIGVPELVWLQYSMLDEIKPNVRDQRHAIGVSIALSGGKVTGIGRKDKQSQTLGLTPILVLVTQLRM